MEGENSPRSWKHCNSVDTSKPQRLSTPLGGHHTVIAEIGAGSYGFVLQTKDPSGNIHAVKVVPVPDSPEHQRFVRRKALFHTFNKANECPNVVHTLEDPWIYRMEKENYVLWRKSMRKYLKVSNLDHPTYFIKNLDYTTIVNVYFVTMKYYPLGSLDTWLLRNEPLSLPSMTARFCLFRDIVTGLSELHQRDLIHGDLCPWNVLLEESTCGLRALISDFGTVMCCGENPLWPVASRSHLLTRSLGTASCSELIRRSATVPQMRRKPIRIIRSTRTAPYQAPETIRGQYGSSCDVFSSGVILLRLLSNRKSSRDLETAITNVQDGGMSAADIRNISDDKRAFVMFDLLKRSLHRDSRNRPTCADFLEESCLKDLRWPQDIREMNNADDGRQLPVEDQVFIWLPIWNEPWFVEILIARNPMNFLKLLTWLALLHRVAYVMFAMLFYGLCGVFYRKAIVINVNDLCAVSCVGWQFESYQGGFATIFLIFMAGSFVSSAADFSMIKGLENGNVQRRSNILSLEDCLSARGMTENILACIVFCMFLYIRSFCKAFIHLTRCDDYDTRYDNTSAIVTILVSAVSIWFDAIDGVSDKLKNIILFMVTVFSCFMVYQREYDQGRNLMVFPSIIAMLLKRCINSPTSELYNLLAIVALAILALVSHLGNEGFDNAFMIFEFCYIAVSVVFYACYLLKCPKMDPSSKPRLLALCAVCVFLASLCITSYCNYSAFNHFLMLFAALHTLCSVIMVVRCSSNNSWFYSVPVAVMVLYTAVLLVSFYWAIVRFLEAFGEFWESPRVVAFFSISGLVVALVCIGVNRKM